MSREGELTAILFFHHHLIRKKRYLKRVKERAVLRTNETMPENAKQSCFWHQKHEWKDKNRRDSF